MALRLRRGTDAERLIMEPPVAGELIYTTDTKAVWVGDGSTPGGLPVSGAALGIDDLGNVTVTAPNDGDILKWNGTAWINTPQESLEKPGNIYGTDSTLLIDTDNSVIVGPIVANTPIIGDLVGDVTGTLTGDVVGDVVGDVTGTLTGNVIGTLAGDVNGSVFADDSTVLVDGVAGTINGTVIGSIESSRQIRVDGTDGLGFIPAGENVFVAEGFMDPLSGRNSGVGMNIRAARDDGLGGLAAVQPGDALLDIVASGYDGNSYKAAMAIKFSVDKNVTVSDEIIPGRIIFAAYDNTGNFGLNSIMVYTSQGRLSIGSGDQPQAKLDVAGEVLLGRLSEAERDALTPVNGMILYNTTANKFQGYENGSWVNLI